VSEDPPRVARLSDDVKSSWHRFLDEIAALRPDLYRYCRHLTHSPWDAEDLVQEASTKAFVTLGTLFGDVPNLRPWLFRIASNLWIDRVRRARFERAVETDEPSSEASDEQGLREAAGTLLTALPPQERVAVVLKDVFEFSIDEIAEALSTSAGAIKAALHRGRGKLTTMAPTPPPRAPAPGVLDAFCEAFNARDLERMTTVLLESATVEIVGVVTEYGRDAPKDPETGSFAGTLSAITIDERGGVPPELLEGYVASSPRCEALPYRNGWILVFWYDHDFGPAVRGLMTLSFDGDRIARVRNWFFSPDVIADVCEELHLPYRVNGYRFWVD
jgi:RNA polymerase sigma-70 factor (ECF subfamily)